MDLKINLDENKKNTEEDKEKLSPETNDVKLDIIANIIELK